MAGRGSLAGMMPYGDANATVIDMVSPPHDMRERRLSGGDQSLLLYALQLTNGNGFQATEILTVIDSTAVMAGVCATDPYRSMPQFLQQLKDLGFCGVQNFPTVGLIDGNFRKNLEATGMSYQKEVEMVRTARQMDLLTAPYVFNVDEAERMTKAGADVVVVHLGLTTGGSIGADEGEMTLDDCVKKVQTIRDACVRVQPDIIVLCHGGPISGENYYPILRTTTLIWPKL